MKPMSIAESVDCFLAFYKMLERLGFTLTEEQRQVVAKLKAAKEFK